MKRFQVRQYITHYRSLTSLGLPIIIGQTGTILLSCADTLMIGHHGTDELAAAAFVNNMFNLVLLFGLGFSYGLTPIVGNLFGREQSPRIGETVKNALAANSLLALLLGAVVTMLYANIGNLGQPTELLPLMRPYLLVLFVSLPFVCWFNVFKQFSDGITDTRTPMWILLGGNILNIIGNYLLIYGKLGLPELGLFGAGISTMLSRVIMTIVFAAIFFLSKRYRIYRVGFIQGKVNRTAFLEQNKLGWPLALQMGMESAAFSLSSIMVRHNGIGCPPNNDDYLAVFLLGILRNGCSCGRKNQLFQRATRLYGCPTQCQRGLSFGIAHRNGRLFTSWFVEKYHRLFVFRQCRSMPSRGNDNHCAHRLPVRRRLAMCLFQCAARPIRRQTADVHRFLCLLYRFASIGLPLRNYLEYGTGRRLVGFSLWLDDGRHTVLRSL